MVLHGPFHVKHALQSSGCVWTSLHACIRMYNTVLHLHSQEARVKPDAAVWNALIAAAGRAGQLQRALDALQDMQVQQLADS